MEETASKKRRRRRKIVSVCQMNIHTSDPLKAKLVQRLSFSRNNAIASSIPF
jgi:hypothetical protein